jgi:protein required for attachment to host cells
MESILRMVIDGSPLVALAQQGTEAVSQVIAVEQSAGNQWGEPSVGNRSDDQAKHAQSQEASSTSGHRRLANNDARRWITQNR